MSEPSAQHPAVLPPTPPTTPQGPCKWAWCDRCLREVVVAYDATQPPEPGTWYGQCQECKAKMGFEGTDVCDAPGQPMKRAFRQMQRQIDEAKLDRQAIADGFIAVTAQIRTLGEAFDAFTRNDPLVNFVRQYDGTNTHCYRARDRAIEIITKLDPSRVGRFVSPDAVLGPAKGRMPASATAPLKINKRVFLKPEPKPKNFFLNEQHTTVAPKRKPKGKNP